MDLLKNNKNIQIKEDNVLDQNSQIKSSEIKHNKPININRYKDSEGLTVGKMAFGLWFVKKRLFFIKIFYICLFIIGVVTWSLFFFTFGKYFIFDIKNDNQNLANFVNTGSVNHEMTLKQLPKDLIIQSVEVLSNNEGSYDFVVKVLNPNIKYYLSLSFFVKHSEGETRVVDNFILPQESRYLLITGEKNNVKPKNLNFLIKKEKWQRISGEIINQYDEFKNDRLNLVFSEKIFIQGKESGLSEKLSLNNLEFKVENKSAFNFWEVPLNIMLFSNFDLIGVKSYTIDKILSEEIKKINIVITGSMATVREIEIEPEINIFDEKAFIDFEGQELEVTDE